MVGCPPEDTAFLSQKKISPEERLIVALDLPGREAALQLVDALGDSVRFYKLGLELFLSGGPFELLEELVARGKKVFLDLKLFDVPETVGSAVRSLRGCGATFLTVHGNERILEAACREKGELGILGVTFLTSLDEDDLRDLGVPPPTSVEEFVLSRARRALAAGCDGIVSSGLEASRVREELGERLLIVSPGIRPLENRVEDDQRRVMTPEAALRAGADYIVVGRPIRRAADPFAAAMRIQESIRRLFA